MCRSYASLMYKSSTHTIKMADNNTQGHKKVMHITELTIQVMLTSTVLLIRSATVKAQARLPAAVQEMSQHSSYQKNSWTLEGSFVSPNQSDNYPQIFAGINYLISWDCGLGWEMMWN